MKRTSPRVQILIALIGAIGLVGCTDAPSAPRPEVATQGSREPLPADGLWNFEEQPGALPTSIYENGDEAKAFALPETTGGGVAVMDWDRDGRLDVVAATGGRLEMRASAIHGSAGAVYRGRGGFVFDAVPTASRIDCESVFHSSIIAADWDNDGFCDIAVTGFANVLMFHNQGDGTFEWLRDGLAEEMGLWSSGAAFFDADDDGDLDVYVVHYANWSFENHPFCPSRNAAQEQDYCGPTDFDGLGDTLYINRGDGTWQGTNDRLAGGTPARGLSVLAADLDGDRRVDLYVANDVQPNFLFHNLGDGNFEEIGTRSGTSNNHLGKPEGSMGIALLDFNADGRYDLWVTNYEHEINALYKNTGNMNFLYASNSLRIPITDERTVGWGTAAADLDADGDEDLLAINGHLEWHATQRMQQPHLLANDGGTRFRKVDVTAEFFRETQLGRGLALADFDQDGRVDFVVSRLHAPCAMVRNATPKVGSTLSVRLVGVESNRDAIGSVLALEVDQKTQVRQVYGGGSYASTSDRSIHFGVPAGASKRGSLRIQWPSGKDQVFEITRWDTDLEIVEGQ